MKTKRKNLLRGAAAALSLAALSNLNANPANPEISILGSGFEVRSGLIHYGNLSKMLNDLKCGESKSEVSKKKSKSAEGKCGESKSKTQEAKCGEAKCGESKSKTKEGKCGEAKCGEKKTTEQPK
ncbi:HvfA family oxazolone/thioamide-modified RiPP metallophore [Schleiferia thermophila]|uniref:HvfA family oxazolone/thioamide-modified RiPP metallophore n=1 Tax=Schleiferia thermophila TaxID=884107 RepID=UPI000DF36883|nr:hypothetical protein [Schleiferia thermophila]GCD79844.1 hypothetical protein JCM30197_10910 [Schleiferia thermophila]